MRLNNSMAWALYHTLSQAQICSLTVAGYIGLRSLGQNPQVFIPGEAPRGIVTRYSLHTSKLVFEIGFPPKAPIHFWPLISMSGAA